MPTLPEPEVWSNETKAYFLLINAMSKEEYDEYRCDVESWGVDLTSIEGLPANYRDQLPSEADWAAQTQPRLERAVV